MALAPMLCSRRSARLTEILGAIQESQPKRRACEMCGGEFIPTRFDRERFCSNRCRYRSKYLRGSSGRLLKGQLSLGSQPGTHPEQATTNPGKVTHQR